jgi:dTDP-4-amino-4,6-dideoxy-D-galactose acyltransferase
MQINILEHLKWDSKFFGYPVARILLDQEGINKLDSVYKKIISEKIRLTYFFVPPAAKKLNSCISKKGGVLVDQKAEYLKMTEEHHDFSNIIVEYQGAEIPDRLKELVLQAGLFSRFRIDTNFKNNEYEKLYIEWLSKSIKQKIAFKTLVVKKGSDPVGITTLGEKAHYAHIGLVAVDKNFRGNRIGHDLISTADNIAFEMGFKEIKIVTQLKNEGACRLYERCHFHIDRITNIYHYWQ